MKPIENLTVSDLSRFPVWEYVTAGDTAVKSVGDLPVESLQDRVVGTRVQLANGDRLWAIMSGVSLRDPRSTRHFLTLSIEKDGGWFHLARYFDVDYAARAPVSWLTFSGCR